jgi:hypothetical protein
MLEATFLVFSRWHVMCGALWEAKVIYNGHWKAFLYDEVPKALDKLVEATGLRTGVSRRGLRKQIQQELSKDSETIRNMDESKKSIRIDILLAGYTKALLDAERIRAQLLVLGVDPGYSIQGTVATAERSGQVESQPSSSGCQVRTTHTESPEGLLKQMKLHTLVDVGTSDANAGSSTGTSMDVA